MKTLGKLKINSEKIMKNEELVTLRGGYDGGWCGCCGVFDETGFILYGSACAYDSQTADNQCTAHYQAILGSSAECYCGAC